MSSDERAAALQKFSQDEACRVLLVSLKCGSLGLNLTCANHVILMDVWWTPAVESQAIDRTHRFGQVFIRLDLLSSIN
jgi:SNF2 family DNA or RNA helicase